jgi:dUTP pyrophosphatase
MQQNHPKKGGFFINNIDFNQQVTYYKKGKKFMLGKLIRYIIHKLKQKILPPPLQVIYKSDNGFTLEKKHENDSCYDLKSNEDLIILEKNAGIVPTGLYLQLEKGSEAQIRSRSGLALNHQIFVLNGIGTIDSGYIGEVKVILFNLGNKDFVIKKGDRIAQIHFARICDTNLTISDSIKEDSDRKNKGFGSTGV